MFVCKHIKISMFNHQTLIVPMAPGRSNVPHQPLHIYELPRNAINIRQYSREEKKRKKKTEQSRLCVYVPKQKKNKKKRTFSSQSASGLTQHCIFHAHTQHVRNTFPFHALSLPALPNPYTHTDAPALGCSYRNVCAPARSDVDFSYVRFPSVIFCFFLFPSESKAKEECLYISKYLQIYFNDSPFSFCIIYFLHFFFCVFTVWFPSCPSFWVSFFFFWAQNSTYFYLCSSFRSAGCSVRLLLFMVTL